MAVLARNETEWERPVRSTTRALADGSARFALSQAIDMHLTVTRLFGPMFDHDYTSLVIFLELLRSSVSHMNHDSAPNPMAEAGLLPDAVRRPVSMLAVSQRTSIPYETVRRHVLRLVDRGLCDRIDNQGFVVPARVMDTLDARRTTLRVVSQVARAASAIHYSVIPPQQKRRSPGQR